MHDRLTIGTILKPHGVRGAVRIACPPDMVAFLATGPEVFVGDRKLRVGSVQGTADRPIVTFVGLDDRNAIEELRGAGIEARREELPELEAEEYYHADLEGCAVFARGERVGTIESVRSLPANEVLTISLDGGGEVLAPFTREAVPEVDIEARRVEVDADFLGLDDDGA